MDVIIDLVVGLFGGLVSVVLWEGVIQPRGERRAIASALAAEVGENVSRLREYLEHSRSDPSAALTTLGRYDTVFVALAPTLTLLEAEHIAKVVEFYRRLAHIEHGFELITSLEADQRHGAAMSGYYSDQRRQILKGVVEAGQVQIEQGEALERLLRQVGRNALRPRALRA